MCCCFLGGWDAGGLTRRLLGRSCNAGYDRSSSGLCVQCPAGNFRLLPQPVAEGATLTKCAGCTSCQDGVNYETTTCTSTQDRVCSTCRASCGAGNRIQTRCTVTSNTVCVPCATKCPAGKYLTDDVCGGSTTNDVVLDNCLACLTESDCAPGRTFLNGLCDGTGKAKNACQGCTPKTCNSGYYSGGCGGLSDTQCLPYRMCKAGEYLSGASGTTDGQCVPCSASCSVLGLTTVASCSRFADTVCGGDMCGAGKPCIGSRRFCDYLATPEQPSCGSCPVRERERCVFFPCGIIPVADLGGARRTGTARTATSAWSARRERHATRQGRWRAWASARAASDRGATRSSGTRSASSRAI